LIGANRISLVGEAHVQRRPVAFGVHRDSRETHLAARSDNPYGYFAAIGD
jgi:hypothetical protein